MIDRAEIEEFKANAAGALADLRRLRAGVPAASEFAPVFAAAEVVVEIAITIAESAIATLVAAERTEADAQQLMADANALLKQARETDERTAQALAELRAARPH